MYSYNRIHNDYDNNVVRVELNSSYRPRATKTASREPMRVASSINRNDTFTSHERPSNIIRSETFILKHHDESSDERPDYNTYTRSKKKSNGSGEKRRDDKSNYSTYSSEKKGNEFEVECLWIHIKWSFWVDHFRRWHWEVSVHQHRYIPQNGQKKIEHESRIWKFKLKYFYEVFKAKTSWKLNKKIRHELLAPSQRSKGEKSVAFGKWYSQTI